MAHQAASEMPGFYPITQNGEHDADAFAIPGPDGGSPNMRFDNDGDRYRIMEDDIIHSHHPVHEQDEQDDAYVGRQHGEALPPAMYDAYLPQAEDKRPSDEILDTTLDDGLTRGTEEHNPNANYRSELPRRQLGHHHLNEHLPHPQVQVFAPGTPALKQSSVPPKEANPGDQMQMLMMNQMMMQQMAAQQQLQAAQLSALSGGNARGQYCGRSNGRGSTSVNIRNCRPGGGQRRFRDPRAIALADVPRVPAAQAALSSTDSLAFENWQEATIILCLAIVGLIYLVTARSTPETEKKPSLAAKHMTS